MRKALLLVALLLAPAWCAAPGLTTVNATLFHELPMSQGDLTPLRGGIAFRNDSGVPLKKLRVVLHVLDGYGRPIMDLPQPEIAQLGPKQVQSLPIYVAAYSGSVAIFQLGADVDAETPTGPQHFVLPAQEAAGPKPNFNY
ncbi:MAG: hypothetical protein J0I12_06015 [Candidatus Eremiobacteraeota bacterium]|nr:hypothetical protein [Candidatus Eremiobacteraeota bacterium]